MVNNCVKEESYLLWDKDPNFGIYRGAVYENQQMHLVAEVLCFCLFDSEILYKTLNNILL